MTRPMSQRPSAIASRTAFLQLGRRSGEVEILLAAGVTHVVFDRAGFRYHGRVKSLADDAREVADGELGLPDGAAAARRDDVAPGPPERDLHRRAGRA